MSKNNQKCPNGTQTVTYKGSNYKVKKSKTKITISPTPKDDKEKKKILKIAGVH